MLDFGQFKLGHPVRRAQHGNPANASVLGWQRNFQHAARNCACARKRTINCISFSIAAVSETAVQEEAVAATAAAAGAPTEHFQQQ